MVLGSLIVRFILIFQGIQTLKSLCEDLLGICFLLLVSSFVFCES